MARAKKQIVSDVPATRRIAASGEVIHTSASIAAEAASQGYREAKAAGPAALKVWKSAQGAKGGEWTSEASDRYHAYLGTSERSARSRRARKAARAQARAAKVASKAASK
jgi:hypothetical protein